MNVASEASVSFFQTLYQAANGTELPTERFEGRSQPYVSGQIDALLKSPATVAMQDEVIAIGKRLGMTIVPGATVGDCSRQQRDLAKRERIREYHAGATDFTAEFLATLPTQAAPLDTSDLPF